MHWRGAVRAETSMTSSCDHWESLDFNGRQPVAMRWPPVVMAGKSLPVRSRRATAWQAMAVGDH